MGCFRRLGCGIAIVLAAVLLWLASPWWLPFFGLHPSRKTSESAPAAPAGPPWELVTQESALSGKAAMRRLAGRAGAVFVNLSGAEFVAYVVDSLSKQLPASAQGTTATVIGDQLFVRMEVRPSDFGADQAPEAIQRMLREREPVEIGGTLAIVRPGLLAFKVGTLRIRGIAMPGPGIPAILARLAPGARPPRFPTDALPLVVPVNVADVRVHNEKVTLYKSGQ